MRRTAAETDELNWLVTGSDLPARPDVAGAAPESVPARPVGSARPPAGSSSSRIVTASVSRNRAFLASLRRMT